jgi:RimJ/RimL family protein N-acetyltransferase
MDRLQSGFQLETERLILRPFTADLFEAYSTLLADPEIFRFSERGPMSSDEAWSRLLRQIGHWAVNGHGLFAVHDKESGHFIGEAGVGDFRRNLGPAFDSQSESSWTIARTAQGCGLATEAISAALDWMERAFGRRRTVCLIHQDNLASIRVAHKLGFTAFAECSYRGYPATLFERR